LKNWQTLKQANRMCECSIIADGNFTPISIKETDIRFAYIDKDGKYHSLIEKFEMEITISKAEVCKIIDDTGKVVGYQFNLR
jgi:hypothetical protein